MENVTVNQQPTSLFNSIASSQKQGLSRKLLIAVLLVSSIFTLIQASYQLYSDYKLGLAEIDQRLEQIFISNKDSIARSIWEVTVDETRIIATGILSLAEVERVTIKEMVDDDSEELVSLQTQSTQDLTGKSFPLDFNDGSNQLVIGELDVFINLQPLYNDLYDKMLFIAVFQTIKTFSVSILIFAIFHYLVTQHLVAMAKFSQAIDESNLDTKFSLQRKKPSHYDELDAMRDALNNTKVSMKKMLESNRSSDNLKIALEQQKLQEKINKAHNLEMAKKNAELEETILELKSTQELLINSEKMAVLGNMVKSVSHELNAPVGVSITGVTHLQKEAERIGKRLDQGKMTKSDLVDFLEETGNVGRSINVSLNKAAQLIHSFKLVSVEQDQEKLADLNIYQNFEDIVNSIRHAFKSRSIVIKNNVSKDIYIRSFPGIFYQVYTNLINNANLHAFEDATQGEILLEACQTEDSLTLTFSDDGKGMSEEVCDQLFEPFFTTKRGNGGTGLGMNIVQTLITDKLCGDVQVTSRVGEGTCFTITVPNAIS